MAKENGSWKIINVKDDVEFIIIAEVIRTIVRNYLLEKFDKVVVIYNHYVNTLVQNVATSVLLPVETNKDLDKTMSTYEFDGEVKTILDEKSFKEAIENIKSVRELKREKSTCLDITPLRHLDLSKSTFRYNETRTNEYLNIIFAYDSVSEKTLTEYIKKLEGDYDLLPNFIYVHKKGIIFTKVNVENDISYLGMNHSINNNYTLSKYGEDGLTAFFILLNAMLEQIQLKSIDYSCLCNNKLDEIKKDNDILIK